MLKLKLQYFGKVWEELTHWERPWCWERLRAKGEEDDRGWDGWMASLTQWTWVWASSGRLWRTGKPGMLPFMGSQRVGYGLESEQQQQLSETISYLSFSVWLTSLSTMISRSIHVAAHLAYCLVFSKLIQLWIIAWPITKWQLWANYSASLTLVFWFQVVIIDVYLIGSVWKLNHIMYIKCSRINFPFFFTFFYLVNDCII